MFTRCLLLIVLLAITSCAFAQQSRSCNLFGHGHIATFAGEQFHITMPGDYLLTGDFVVRLEQCPGSKTGAVCLTGFRTSSGDEVYYNRETNTCEKSDGTNLQACSNSFDGVLRGFHESGTDYEFTFTNYGSSLTIREFGGINNGTNLGLCGKRRFLSTGRTDQDWEDTAHVFYPSEANQAEINKYAHTHTVNTQSRDTLQFEYRSEPADPGFGDFSSWKSYAPKDLDESTCGRIGKINSFLGKACSYDVKAAGTDNARVAAYWALRDSCWSVFNTHNKNGLVGLFADYDDLAICDPVLSEHYMEVLHDFKDSDEHPFDVDAEPLHPAKSIMNKEGNIQDRFAITPNHNVGGKYTYRVRYRDECGKEIEHTTQVNIRCNAPPSANAGEDMSFEKNTPIVVRAKMSDEDGDNLVFSWKFIDWPDKENGISIDDRVSDPTGYGSEYFHFQPTHVGRYTLQLAVSDYCNVAFDTINIDSFCNECDEKLVLDQDGKFEHPGKATEGDGYGTVTFQNVDPDFQSPEFQTVEVSVLNDEYQLKRDEVSGDPDYDHQWEVRTAYDINGPNENTFTDSTTDDCVGNSTESFVQRLRIPPYAFRGKTVLDIDYTSDDYVDEFRRVSEEVMHHQYYCYEQRTENTTTVTTWTYDPPTTPVCKLQVGSISGETSLDFDYSRMGTDGTGYSLNRCDHSFEFTFNATGECSTQSSSAIATAKCPVPQANPTCPDVIYYDYDSLSFADVDLDGRDSSSGALEDASESSYNSNWLNYNWELVSSPSSSGSISDPSITQPTLQGISRPGDYQIRLTVDNNCRSNDGEIMVTAVCGLPVPSNMSSITIEEDPNHNVDVDARGVQAARDDLALTASVSVTSWPSELSDRISKINEYVSPRNIISEPGDSEQIIAPSSTENVLSTSVSYEDIMVAGDHTFSFDVSDPCHGTSAEETIPLSCPHDSFTLDVFVNGKDPSNVPDPSYNASGYPTFDIYGSISDEGDIDPNWYVYLKVEREDGEVIEYGDPDLQTNPDFEYINGNAIGVPSSGTYNFKLLATDSDRCHTREETWSVTVNCPDAPSISSTTEQEFTTYASKENETESIIFSASFSAPSDTDPVVQWEFRNDDGQWVGISSFSVPSLDVVYDNATIGETSGDAFLELQVDDYAPLGTYSFRAFINYGGDNNNECGTNSVEYTVTVECPRADVGVDANPNGLSTSYTFTDNHFPTVRVKGGISNNDEHVTPIEKYRYMWIFTSVPDDSAYFPETSDTTPEQPYPYLDYTDVDDNEDDDDQDGRTVYTGRTRVVEQVKHYRTYKVYRHSVLNAADVSITDPATFGFHEFSVFYDRDEHDFDGCFVPDVSGTYTLRFETRPELGSNNFPEQCALTDTLDIEVNCNDAPSISLEGADSDGVLSVTKTALHADRVQLHFTIENDDEHMIHSELVSSPFDTVEPISTPELWEEHSERPSFLASRAGDYVIRITADDGCTRTTEEFTIRVTCSNGISFSEESKTYTVDYSSKVDISQMSFPVLPETNDKFSCMLHSTPDVSTNQQSGFVDIELVDWEAPDSIPEPEPSSESTTGGDQTETTSGAVPMVSFQPQAIIMALVAALLALLM